MDSEYGSLGDRIKFVRLKIMNLTQDGFAESVGGISKFAVSHWERNNTSPSIAQLKKIGDISGKTVNWLLYGNDHGYLITKPGSLIAENVNDYGAGYDIPVVSMIAAGISELGDEVDRAPKITLPYKEAKGCIAFQVTGDSMAPLYVEGDILIVKERGGEMPRDGFIYVVEWEEDTKVMRAVKYVHFASPGFLLTSKNRKHKAVKIDNIRRLFRIVFEITRFHEQLA